MKNQKIIFPIIILALGFFVSWGIVVKAQTGNANPTFPIAELGNCKDKADCKAYCDKKENLTACINYGETHGMISADEAAKAKAFVSEGTGPGNCKSKTECETFCNAEGNMEACFDFALQHNLVKGEEAGQAQKVIAALKKGTNLPGGCRSLTQCKDYCNDNSHINECVSFAEASGVLPADQLAEAKKVAQAMSSGAQLPGQCKNKADCENYCADSSHMEECLNFGEKSGLIPQSEVDQARKVLPLIKSGEMPGGCKTKDSCQTYCADQTHADECANFAIKTGLMSSEDAAMYKKTGGVGPGGCKGKEACQAYCNDPANSQGCLNYAEEKGLIPTEKIKEIKDGMAQLKSGVLTKAPQEIQDCVKSAVGTENYDNLRNGTFTPGEQAGDQIKACFEKMADIMMKQQGGQSPAGMMPQGIPEEFKNSKTPPARDEINKVIEEKKSQMIKDNASQLPDGTPQSIPKQFKNNKTPPTQDEINKVIEQKKAEIMQRQGGQMPVSGQTSQGIPAGGAPSAEQIQKMMQQGGAPAGEASQNIPQGMGL